MVCSSVRALLEERFDASAAVVQCAATTFAATLNRVVRSVGGIEGMQNIQGRLTYDEKLTE